MRYATTYDVGDRKRETGINEDSVAVTVFEHGHREGYVGKPVRDAMSARPDEDSKRQDESDSDEQAGGSEASEEDDKPANRSGAVFALADGAGGHDAGDVASYIATTVICEELASVAVRGASVEPDSFSVDVPTVPDPPSDEDIRAAIQSAIVTAHREILRAVGEMGGGAYTTVVAGIVVDGEIHYGWVGDSRAYVINRSRGTIARLTEDHAVVEQLHQAGEIDDVEARVHPRGNEITRALGGTGSSDPDDATVSVETRSVPFYAEDVLLVTSDGLIDAQTDAPQLYDQYHESDRSDEVAETIQERVVTDDEIRENVMSTAELDEAARSLIDLGNDRGGKDNLSLVLLSDPALDPTPEDANLGFRSIDAPPIEDRETVIVPDN
jgi:serine/threonine protein phosphatase PrpC